MSCDNFVEFEFDGVIHLRKRLAGVSTTVVI
jgi:hypothetical protein